MPPAIMMLRRFGLAIGLALALCPAPVRADAPSVIHIAFSSIGVGGRQYSPTSSLAVVHVQGLLEKEFAGTGTKIEWSFHKGAGPAVNEEIANGTIDFASQGDLPSIVHRSVGIKTRLLLSMGTGGDYLLAVPPDSAITSLAGLRGHTVAAFQGTAGELVVDRLLGTVGLTERDLHVISLDNSTAKAALATERVEAAFGTFDMLDLEHQGLAKIIYRSKIEAPSIVAQSHFLVTEAFAEKYPDIVDKVVRVVVAAARWASEESNRQALYAIWAKSGAPSYYYQDAYGGKDLRVVMSPYLDDLAVARYKRSVADCLRLGLIRTPIDVDSWIDREPLNAAVKSLGLEGYWPQFDQDGHPKAPE